MSDTAALALLIASIFPGAFVFFYSSKMATDAGNEVLTGVIRGMPISTKVRWLFLHQKYVGYVLGTVSVGILMAAVNVQIAAHAPDAAIRTVAYLAAFVSAAAASISALSSFAGFIYYRSVLRQAEGD
jgi:hypothetical protein